MRAAATPALALYLCVLALALCVLPDRVLSDEHVHWPQVLRFATGDWHVDPWLSTWPTMNALVSLPVRVLSIQQLWVGRVTIATSAMLAFAGMVALLQALHGTSLSRNQATLRALQFMLAPITLLFSTLVYTDLPALAALLWAAYAALTGRRVLLLAAGVATVAFRQSHIIWFVALALWFLYERAREASPASLDERAWRTVVSLFFAALRRERIVLIASIAVVALWVLIVQMTGGVAYGSNTRQGHFLRLAGAPNACFSMVVATIVFAPIYGAVLWRQRHLVTVRNFVFGALLLVAIAWLFEASEPGNVHPAAQVLWRNRILSLLQHPFGRIVLDVACLLGFYVSSTMPVAPAARILRIGALVFGVLSVLPFGLIEQRYYLPMLALLWVCRASQNSRVEWAQLAWSLLLSSLLLQQVVVAGRFL